MVGWPSKVPVIVVGRPSVMTSIVLGWLMKVVGWPSIVRAIMVGWPNIVTSIVVG